MMGLNTLFAVTDDFLWFGIYGMSIAIVVILLTRYYPWRRNDDQLLTPTVPSDIGFPSPAPDSYLDHKQAFDLLYQSEELKGLLRYTPSSTRPMAWSALWISLGLVFIALGIVGQLDSTAATVLIVLGVCPLGIGVYDLLKFGLFPLKRLPAIVVSKSKQVYAGDAEGAIGGALLLVYIETRDGHTQQCDISLKLFLKIEQEDIGIAYIRGDYMLDFKKVSLKET